MTKKGRKREFKITAETTGVVTGLFSNRVERFKQTVIIHARSYSEAQEIFYKYGAVKNEDGIRTVITEIEELK